MVHRPDISDRHDAAFGADAEAHLDSGWSPDLAKAQVYDRILMDIVLGILAPGAALDEQTLAHDYEASLAAIREALGRPALEGLIIRKPRAGARVAPIDAFEARQVLEVRRLIEPHAAALAAEFASPEDIEALDHVFDDAEAAIRSGDYRTLFLMDHEFHVRLARASGNPALARIIAPLQLKAARFWACSMAAGEGPENRVAVDQAEVDSHRAMVKLISKRDTAGARAAAMKALGVVRHDVDRLSALAAPSKVRQVPSIV